MMNTTLRHGALLVLLLCGLTRPALALGLSVTITSSPVVTAAAGDAYSYDVEAVSNDPAATLLYTLREGPAGMAMDGATGLISWSPALAGEHRVRLRVKARAGDGVEAEAEQEYRLRVSGTGASVIRGSVRDSAGKGLALIEVKLFDPTGTQRLYRTRTDSTGAYAISGVAAGTYLAKADPEDGSVWDDQWFDHVGRREQATPVVMGASGELIADFDLRVRTGGDDVSYAVSGVVRGTDGTGVGGALVSFLRRGGVDDPQPHLRGGSGHSRGHDRHEFTVRADSAGRFQARVKARTYVIRAQAEGRLPQYWDHAASFTAAKRLTLVSDTSGIDFDMVPAGGAAATAVRQEPVHARLDQNYPNPFNPTTSIRFSVPEAGHVRLQVYNAIGQRVAELVNGSMSAGIHAVEWNAGSAASGVYFTRLEYGGTVDMRRMQLVR